MANAKKTNGNAYTLVYAAVLVIIVAFLLSFIASVLKDRQVANERLDKKAQILAAVNVKGGDTEADYARYVAQELILDANGQVKQTEGGFEADFNRATDADNQPLYVCDINGATKYIVPLRGAGLWGPIWGYIGLDDDKSTVYGIYFAHEGETPGLGAEIATDKFQQPFLGKHIQRDGQLVSIAVLKKGQTTDTQDQVDAISGGTITSNGVNAMLRDCLAAYKSFLTQLPKTAQQPATADTTAIAADTTAIQADTTALTINK